MSGWKKALRKFWRGEVDEISVREGSEDAPPGPVTLDHQFARLPALRKNKSGGPVNTLEQPKRKRKRGSRAAKRAAAAAGMNWALLSKSQRRDLRLLARAEKGSRKAAEKLLKRFGLTRPASTPMPATAGADGILLKSVLPHQPDPAAAQSAIDAIRAALARPQAGAGGWRP